MDNLSTHKGSRVRELIEERGSELMYVPAYSPDYNPIEETFAKVKGILRKAQDRIREVLVEAIGATLSVVSTHDARRTVLHRGYHPLDQPLRQPL